MRSGFSVNAPLDGEPFLAQTPVAILTEAYEVLVAPEPRLR